MDRVAPRVTWPDTDWESAICPLCGREPQETLYTNCSDRLHGIPGRFTYVRCTRCSLVFMNPRPTETAVANYYPPDYPPFHLEEMDEGGVLERLVLKHLVHCRFPTPPLGVNNTGRAPRILDIGCGAGAYLRRRALAGWEAWGLEPDATAAERARQAPEITRILTGNIAEASSHIPREYFDLVSFRDVLEHLHDPLRGLQFAMDVLLPGGYVEIFTPDIASYEARLFGKDWFPIEAPRHIFLYSRKTLRLLLVRAGFQFSMSCPTLTAGPAYLSFHYVVESKFRRKLSFNKLSRMVVFSIFTPITLALAVVGNSGAALEIWGQKPDVD
jgi:SAM-dependent methyltransferase